MMAVATFRSTSVFIIDHKNKVLLVDNIVANVFGHFTKGLAKNAEFYIPGLKLLLLPFLLPVILHVNYVLLFEKKNLF